MLSVRNCTLFKMKFSIRKYSYLIIFWSIKNSPTCRSPVYSNTENDNYSYQRMNELSAKLTHEEFVIIIHLKDANLQQPAYDEISKILTIYTRKGLYIMC